MDRYWGKPELTAAALRDGWLHTGDLGSSTRTGFVLPQPREGHAEAARARTSRRVRSSWRWSSHPAVVEAAVVGVFDPHHEERVVADRRRRRLARGAGAHCASYSPRSRSPPSSSGWRSCQDLDRKDQQGRDQKRDRSDGALTHGCKDGWRSSPARPRGFGRATAQRLLEEGAAVALWDIEPRRSRRSGGLADLGPTLGLDVDVGDRARSRRPRPARGRSSARSTRSSTAPGRLLGASLGGGGGELAAPLPGQHRRHLVAVQACLPDMRERRYGKIVNIGSLAAQQGRPTTSPAYPPRRARSSA